MIVDSCFILLILKCKANHSTYAGNRVPVCGPNLIDLFVDDMCHKAPMKDYIAMADTQLINVWD